MSNLAIISWGVFDEPISGFIGLAIFGREGSFVGGFRVGRRDYDKQYGS